MMAYSVNIFVRSYTDLFDIVSKECICAIVISWRTNTTIMKNPHKYI